MSDYVKSAVASASLDKTVYGLPQDVCSPALYYRRDLFEEAGLKIPGTTPEEAYTPEDYLKAAVELNIPGERWGTVITAMKHPETTAQILNWMYMFGCPVVTDTGEVCVNNSEGIKAIEFVADLINKQQVAPREGINYFCVDAHTLFVEDQVAMCPGWPYFPYVAEDPTSSKIIGKWDVGVMPLAGRDPSRYYYFGDVWSWVMAKGIPEPRKKVAWEFMKWIASTQLQTEMFKLSGELPGRYSCFKDPALNTKPVAVHLAQQDRSKAYNMQALGLAYGKFEQAMLEMYQAVILGQASARDALDTASIKIEAALQEQAARK
jgi:multiple sugar transport system substrate-binding protein